MEQVTQNGDYLDLSKRSEQLKSEHRVLFTCTLHDDVMDPVGLARAQC